MNDVLFLVIIYGGGLVAAAAVVLAWLHVHRQHREAWARRIAERARRAEAEKRAPEEAPQVPAAAPAVVPTPAPATWAEPLPLHVPRPTYWPAVLALGVVLMAWGFISNFILILAGFTAFVLALAFWIQEMLHAESSPPPLSLDPGNGRS